MIVEYVALDDRFILFVGLSLWRFDGFNLLIFYNSQLYKCFHLINFVMSAYMRRNSLRMMYKHQNM